MNPKTDNLFGKRKIFLIECRSGNNPSSNSREVTSKWNFSQNHWWNPKTYCKSMISTLSQEPLFSTFLEVISIFLDIGNNPNKLYIFEKLRSGSRRWCYFQGCSCYKKCTLATISMLAPNTQFESKFCSIVRPKSDNLIRKGNKFLIQRRSGNYSSPNSREVTSKWKFEKVGEILRNHVFGFSFWCNFAAIWARIICRPALNQDLFSLSNEIIRFGSRNATILVWISIWS